jgi:hypothetical protein
MTQLDRQNRYQEIMAHELEEERRRDKFYAIDPSLNDDDYFKELGAKDEALMRLTARLQKQSDLAAALEGSDRAGSPGPKLLQVTYLNADNSGSAASPKAQPKPSHAAAAQWNPRFFLEVSQDGGDGGAGNSAGSAAIGEATFEKLPSQDEWVPTRVKIWRCSVDAEILDAHLPLPHGLKYVSLRSLSASSSIASSSQ